jgi:hypothetical protein
VRQNDVRFERNQFLRRFSNAIAIAARPAVFDPNVLADDPTRMLETLNKRRDTCHHFRISFRASHQRTDSAHLRTLLRAGRKRIYSSRTSKKRDELASSHYRPRDSGT